MTEYISLEKVKKYLSNDEIGKEKFKLIQSVPPRFRDDAYYALEYCEDYNTIRKSWEYFLDDIFQELTLDEKVEYNFTTCTKINIEQIALDIATELMYEYEENKVIHDETVEKDCYYAVGDIKGDIRYEVDKYLEQQGYKVS